ncbi:MAG: hypothetical protein U0528_09305 [Anaerolineae bacterium]
MAWSELLWQHHAAAPDIISPPLPQSQWIRQPRNPPAPPVDPHLAGAVREDRSRVIQILENTGIGVSSRRAADI